jgi:hypothetical protein
MSKKHSQEAEGPFVTLPEYLKNNALPNSKPKKERESSNNN